MRLAIFLVLVCLGVFGYRRWERDRFWRPAKIAMAAREARIQWQSWTIEARMVGRITNKFLVVKAEEGDDTPLPLHLSLIPFTTALALENRFGDFQHGKEEAFTTGLSATHHLQLVLGPTANAKAVQDVFDLLVDHKQPVVSMTMTRLEVVRVLLNDGKAPWSGKEGFVLDELKVTEESHVPPVGKTGYPGEGRVTESTP